MSVAEHLERTIKAGGPIPVAQFMAEALAEYYGGRDPFGAKGDFTTAPEISQMFGEMIGLWCIVVWQMMGAPRSFVLAEIGPGRGTLMADLLRSAATHPPFLAAASPWLIETSPALRKVQQKTLSGHEIQWAERFEDLPDGPLLLVANELFDALPIRQFEKRDGKWFERMVAWGEHGFEFTQGPEALPDLPQPVLDAPDGAVAEICPQGRVLAEAIGRRLGREPGAALIIDYGYARSSVGDSLQALRRHKFHPVLDAPGTADLTAHVDFQSLAEAAIPARAWGPVDQGDFLRRLGIETRAALLAQAGGAKVETDLMGQLRRLIDPGEMGTLFKVLALAHPALPLPPGLEP